MAKPNKPNYILLAVSAILIIWGIFTLATVSFPFSLEKYGHSWYYFQHQLIYGIAPGLILGFIAFKTKLEKLKKVSFLLFLANIFLLALIFVPDLGAEINGARRWLKIGSIMFQPSEFIKLSFLIYISAWLSNRLSSKKKSSTNRKQAFAVFLIVSIIVISLLILERDMSTLAIIFLIGLIVYFASSTPWWHILVFSGFIAGIGALLVKFEPYRLNRIITLLNPEIDPLGKGYQLKQSLIAIGSGKISGIGEFFGKGLGLSRQKFGFLPQPMTDSVFAVIGEELGFIGCFLLISLFIVFLWQGIKTSLSSNNQFAKLLALGIACWICFQTFFNIAGIIGILPLAGIPLPFFSYGSSHLIAELIGIGILLNISKKQS